MKNSFGAAVILVGAVIGAGFASGREIVSFFTRYGGDSWWLILLASGMMSGVCWLCMRCTLSCEAQNNWCRMFGKNGTGAQLCVALLLCISGGAMLSAAGELAALAWCSEWAYSLGAAGTMVAAWMLGRQKQRILGWVSGALMALVLCVMMLAMRYAPENGGVLLKRTADGRQLFAAAGRAAAYASMNMALAVGMICRSTKANPNSVCFLFGGMMTVLLYMGNALYLRHPEVLDHPFPVVQMLRCFGTDGFRVSIILLWLAALTSLTAVMRALDHVAEGVLHHPAWRTALVWCAPVAASRMGFAGIVDHLYVPAGILCLLLVFAPLLISEICTVRKERLDNLNWIQ